MPLRSALLEVVEEEGYVFSTLGGYGPHSQYSISTCVSEWEEYLPLPAGWAVAPQNEISVNVTAKYDWGALRLVLDTGSSYFTNSLISADHRYEWYYYWYYWYYWNYFPGSYYSNGYLSSYDNVYYRSTDCESRVLLMAPMCAAGYMLSPPAVSGSGPSNSSRCIPCTNTIPTDAHYVISPYPQEATSCGWSCQVGFYPTGSSCSKCVGKPSAAVYVATGLMGKPDSCDWSCLPGYHEVEGWKCEACSSPAPLNAHWEGSGCSWACDFGFRLSQGGTCEDISIKYMGQRYASLEGRGPYDSSMCIWEGARRLPEGWMLAPNTLDSIAVAAEFPWGSNIVVLEDGTAWNAGYGSMCCGSQLYSYDGFYRTRDFCGTVLVVAQECLPGHHRDANNMTLCVPCTNWKPEHTTYNSSGSPVYKNNCDWECDDGFYPSASATSCVSCSLAPPHAVYSSSPGDSCSWTCLVGYYRQGASCVTCQVNLPDFAYFLGSPDGSKNCEWACRFGYIRRGQRCIGVEFAGRFYTTLAGRGPHDSQICTSQEYLPVPSGWELAPNDDNSKRVTWMYPWGSCGMVLSDGSEWHTAWCTSSNTFEFCCWHALYSYNGLYQPDSCWDSVLLRSIDCAPGYTKSGSNCEPCSNKIPAESSYGLVVANNNQLLDASCAFVCNAGYKQRDGICQPCDNAMKPLNSEYIQVNQRNDPMYECQWRCLNGYFLKDGQCVACEDKKPRWARWLPEGDNGMTCGWACDFGYFVSAEGDCLPLEVQGRYYAALDGSSPYKPYYGCNYNHELYPMPAGWEIAPDSRDSQLTAWRYSWGRCGLMVANGQTWCTAGCCSSWTPQDCCSSLVSYDGMYRSTDSCTSVLLVSHYCAAGYYLRNDSSCGNCSNPIPPHALYARQPDPRRYDDSVCAWECEPGYVRQGEACEPCKTAPEHAEYVAYGPGGVNGSWTVCGWRCEGGYFLKDGQCVACEDKKPRWARWLPEGDNGTTCGWACDFGRFLTSSHVRGNSSSCELFEYGNRYYASLNGHRAQDYYSCNTPMSFHSIPAGWAVASNTWESQMAIASQRWGVCYMQLSDGNLYYTSNCYCCNWPWAWTWSQVSSFNGQYRAYDSCSDILLASLYCAPGFYLSGSYCYACSNPIPANASYALATSPSQYADSKCPWECNAGFYRSSEWMVCFPCTNPIPKFAYYSSAGLLDQPDSCQWSCAIDGRDGQACNVSVDLQHVVRYSGKVYAAFDDVSPTSLDRTCQRDGSLYQQPPVGWTLASWSQEAVKVIASYPWGARGMVLADGYGYQTAKPYQDYKGFETPGTMIIMSNLYRSGDSYALQYCDDGYNAFRMLLVRLECDDGYQGRGDQECQPCSLSLPANAVASSGPSGCAWACREGYYKLHEGCSLCDSRYPKPNNAVYVADDGSSRSICPWRCSTGHYRSQGACLPCSSTPNFATYIDSPSSECSWRCLPGYFKMGLLCLPCTSPPLTDSGVLVRPAAVLCDVTASCSGDSVESMRYQCSWIPAVSSSSGDEYAVLMDNMTDPWDPLQGPVTSSNQRLQCGMVQLPAGWQVAPNDKDAVGVIARYPWGLDRLVVADGTVYSTSNQDYTPAGTVVQLDGLTKSIRTDAELYALAPGQYCQNTRILIKKIRCAPGQFVSASSCRPCSSPVCGSGQHALPCSELQDSICSSAIKPCTGKCRCKLYEETNGFLTDGSSLSSLYEDRSNCRWIIQPPGASSISINFTSFALEAGYDFLTINQCIGLAGTTLECIGRTEVAKLTGSHMPGSLSYASSYGIVEVLFQTDDSVAYQGFTMMWTANVSNSTLSRYWFAKQQFLHCQIQHSWKEIIQGLSTGNETYKMGGLGQLMIRRVMEVWVCSYADACATPGDAFCYIYDEQRKLFVPWDMGGNLKLI
ncbi:hypothetical protein GUITHDRAFT_114193 [Guillardia theta CCMP2712]|uniref:CUB domain-containing protein n=1 Tax=Guillardia theta (strain CCMP2712) TaxID=905079 RepID=L1ITX8_GUITC|nr:hypothetical protein GUITHDRAFT_114193 [Guillardia theta CCMP2712]EKX39698.1 hypothetical protein GUITHDRAFT_114193 [Guillardia theta CCMP2712]|eukprot:XP_005826678.1 hypothetical protein GUITHDRAFT_114193 [Guillardia theta CCMP2712]